MKDYYSDILAEQDIVTRARKCIKKARHDLGYLSEGQRRDLLKDNFCISHEEACLLVNFIG